MYLVRLSRSFLYSLMSRKQTIYCIVIQKKQSLMGISSLQIHTEKSHELETFGQYRNHLNLYLGRWLKPLSQLISNTEFLQIVDRIMDYYGQYPVAVARVLYRNRTDTCLDWMAFTNSIPGVALSIFLFPKLMGLADQSHFLTAIRHWNFHPIPSNRLKSLPIFEIHVKASCQVNPMLEIKWINYSVLLSLISVSN